MSEPLEPPAPRTPREAKAHAKADKAYRRASRPAWKKKRTWLLGFAGLLVLISIINSIGGGGGESKSTRASAASDDTTPPAAASSSSSAPAPSATETKAPAVPTWGDGTHLVGSDMPAGTYRAKGGFGCYWERDKDTAGDMGSILANENAAGPTVVTLEAGDAAFKTRGCGKWSAVTPGGVPVASFEDGDYLVGTDIAAGTYKSSGGDTCYWSRNKDASGDMGSIIANDNAVGAAVVTISSTDVEFVTHGCGTWMKA